MNSQDLDKRLNALWFRRDDLNPAEWRELYVLVRRILDGYAPSELNTLPDEHADYIHGFFVNKVLDATHRTTDGGKHTRIHSGAIRYFFKNYLRDCLDAGKRNPLQQVSVSLSPADDHDDEGARIPFDPCGCPDIDLHLLEEMGLSSEKVRESAQTWLDHQASWVLLYLGLHHCPDDEASLPLSTLVRHYQIASYHHKARKLGITHRKEERGPAWFRNSLLGEWLENDLGLAITAEHAPAIAAALDLLCRVAIERALRLAKSPPGAR